VPEETEAGFAVTCPQCNRPVIMKVHGRWTAFPDPEGLPQEWSAAECPECRQATLYLREHIGGPLNDGWDDYWQAYPPQARKMSSAVPRNLRKDHEEARGCLQGRLYTAAAIMARRILEGICVDRGYTSGDLFNRLKKMRDDGVIDARLYEWADAGRQVGNEGAHASGVTVSREDAEEVLRFVEALLDYLYVFQVRFDEFKSRRDAEKAARAMKATKRSSHSAHQAKAKSIP
jgi:hypothetical protein